MLCHFFVTYICRVKQTQTQKPKVMKHLSKQQLIERATELESQLDRLINWGNHDAADAVAYQLRQVFVELETR